MNPDKLLELVTKWRHVAEHELPEDAAVALAYKRCAVDLQAELTVLACERERLRELVEDLVREWEQGATNRVEGDFRGHPQVLQEARMLRICAKHLSWVLNRLEPLPKGG